MFDEMLSNSKISKKLTNKWTKSLPALVRTPLFSEITGRGYVVCFFEKTRDYSLQCFDVENGKTLWTTNIPNGGYGAHAIGDKIIAVSSKFTDLTGINATTGEVAWTISTNARIRSPVAYINGDFIFSSGENIYLLKESGKIKRKFSVSHRFFFGLIKLSRGNLLSLATCNNSYGESQLELLSITLDGKILWKNKLGPSPIISSETSGIAISNDHIYCCAEKILHCIAINDGEIIWSRELEDFSGRQIPTISGDKLFLPSIEGCIYCFDKNDGQLLWKYRGKSIATTPVSILGEWACVCLDGQLHLIDAETGKIFDRLSTGHSPYSALTFWKNKAYLGGGDPPYQGRLYCFDCVDRDFICEYSIKITTSSLKKDNGKFLLKLKVCNSPHEIIKISLDSSVISAAQTNGGTYQAAPISRCGNNFTFIIPIRQMIVPGTYSIECKLTLETGINIFRTVIIHIKSNQPRPHRHVISDVTPIAQKNSLLSGAAAMQMLQKYYKQPITEQEDIREMVDYIRHRSNYEPFNVWRIALRRVISSNAPSKHHLPEFEKKLI